MNTLIFVLCIHIHIAYITAMMLGMPCFINYGFIDVISKMVYFNPSSLQDTVQCNLNLLVSDSSILTGEVNKVAIISSQPQLG